MLPGANLNGGTKDVRKVQEPPENTGVKEARKLEEKMDGICGKRIKAITRAKEL